MKKIFGALAVAGAVTFATQANAMELWDPHLRGADEGLAGGALPPPGVYGVLDNYWADYNLYNNSGKEVPNTGLNALVEVPIVLWNTGLKVLGGDFAVAAAQPFDYTSIGSGYGLPTGSGNWGTYNTLLVPAWISWALPNDLHASASLFVYLPDASGYKGQILQGKSFNGGLPSGLGYAAVEPTLGLSWLHDGWNLSVSAHLSIPVSKDSAGPYSYMDGDEVAVDWTATKTIGKWTVGLGVHNENQITNDSANAFAVKAGLLEGKAVNFGLGPIVGYNFGGIDIQATWNHAIYTRNDVAGDFFNVRMVTAF